VPVLHAGWYRGQWFLWAGSSSLSESSPAQPAAELKRCIGRILPQLKEVESPRALQLWLPTPDAVDFRPTTVYGLALRPPLLTPLVEWGSQWPTGCHEVVPSREFLILAEAYRFAYGLVREGAYIPGLAYRLGYFRPTWKAWWTPPRNTYLQALSACLPDVSRALAHPPLSALSLLRQWVDDVLDGAVREASRPLTEELTGPLGDWLKGLLSPERGRIEPRSLATLLARGLLKWEHDARHRMAIPYRVCFRIEENLSATAHDGNAWYVHFLAESTQSPEMPIDPLDADLDRSDWTELLHWAAHHSGEVASALSSNDLEGFSLDTPALLYFLEHDAPALRATGATILLPAWWRGRKRRITLTAHVTPTATTTIHLGNANLVDWTVALGEDPISLDELRVLAASQERLVQFRGQWIELSDDVAEWAHRLQSLPAEIDTGTAIRWGIEGHITSGPAGEADRLPAAVQAEGWLAEVIERLVTHESMESIAPSSAFRGTLRPYQLRGLAWLDFLHRFGLGACLADDMGLGKTIQALALLDRDYQSGIHRPVLLICPTSVVSNWQHEALRFTPELPTHIHQGSDRLHGRDLADAASQAGLVVTSYPILRTDAEDLLSMDWYGVILDEAQNIKNASTRQSQIACQLASDYRLALTGTPLENRLEELWALMRFLNPGLLGTQDEFHRQYASLNDPHTLQHDLSPLQRQIEPFVLRRLKTDPAIIDDLPDKIEIKEFCHVTREQASLYQAVLDGMVQDIDHLEGINRRGVILATLTRLKQILNHPAHYLGDHSKLEGRSGKLTRLNELVEEVLSENHRALIFTQFAEMGALLEQYLFERWGERPLFLHGGIKPKDREVMVHRFQTETDGPNLFILSLRAGGTGLNLTAASHVVHYDRWWNPAVENQATDRAFRIGQHQNVTVHKFVSVGTVEERIDRMIAEKTLLAERIVGTGESWITELSTDDLHQLLALQTPGEDEND